MIDYQRTKTNPIYLTSGALWRKFLDGPHPSHSVCHLYCRNAFIILTLSEHKGLPHTLRQDDVYEGYNLPKGTTVLSNVWCVFCLNSKYPD